MVLFGTLLVSPPPNEWLINTLSQSVEMRVEPKSAFKKAGSCGRVAWSGCTPMSGGYSPCWRKDTDTFPKQVQHGDIRHTQPAQRNCIGNHRLPALAGTATAGQRLRGRALRIFERRCTAPLATCVPGRHEQSGDRPADRGRSGALPAHAGFLDALTQHLKQWILLAICGCEASVFEL
jgi:hypothetical protein